VEGNVRGNSFQGKDRWEGWGSECDLVNDVGVFVVIGHVRTCDLKKTIFDNQLGEDRVGLGILYWSSNV